MHLQLMSCTAILNLVHKTGTQPQPVCHLDMCIHECASLHHVNIFLYSSEMNMESSRSHLIIGIVIESTNLTTGAVIKGKVTILIQLLQ